MTETDQTAAITQVIERLATRFPTIAADVVEEVVAEALTQFDGAPNRDFVPLLVEHDAAEKLWLMTESGD
jgi:hypothetical protein